MKRTIVIRAEFLAVIIVPRPKKELKTCRSSNKDCAICDPVTPHWQIFCANPPPQKKTSVRKGACIHSKLKGT
ncbi:Hypothetical predicted protein [Podarcis lilfordi]|uniref:Uncharacterized protein n=1 Tax=Podarcis lilfordi TaxID=74358 RepID=A0AA35L306_9SAUR|nr:Hypothetical predicted protein [Podarcis lilfordi]